MAKASHDTDTDDETGTHSICSEHQTDLTVLHRKQSELQKTSIYSSSDIGRDDTDSLISSISTDTDHSVYQPPPVLTKRRGSSQFGNVVNTTPSNTYSR